MPPTLELLDIAANYTWQRLVPGALEEPGQSQLIDWLNDPDHPATWRRRPLPCSRSASTSTDSRSSLPPSMAANLHQNFTLFRLWSQLNLHIDLHQAEAADWIAAAAAWLLSTQKDEKSRNAAWAELTTPGRLPTWVPGVLPEWMG